MKTVRVMISLYCHDMHGTADQHCEECTALWEYAHRRVEKCPYGAEKPTCANCPVHCYKPAMREQIRTVMRYAGPRMMWRHPVLAVLHLLDGWRRPPQR